MCTKYLPLYNIDVMKLIIFFYQFAILNLQKTGNLKYFLCTDIDFFLDFLFQKKFNQKIILLTSLRIVF